MSDDPGKTKSRRFNFSFKNLLLGISVLVVIYLLISGWQINKVNIGFLELVSPTTVTDNFTKIIQVTAALRPLEPLETQQNIAFLPDNIYGYAYAFEIADYQNSIDLSNVCDGYQFEVQKYSGHNYLIGYVSETDLNAITSAKSGTKITVYPYNVKKDKKIIGLDLNNISEVSDKDVDIDETTTISILELTTVSNQIPSEVIEHRTKSCL
jgi:hypothetical protein